MDTYHSTLDQRFILYTTRLIEVGNVDECKVCRCAKIGGNVPVMCAGARWKWNCCILESAFHVLDYEVD